MINILIRILYLAAIWLSVYTSGWLLLKANRNGTTGALAACQLLVIIWCVPPLFAAIPATKGMKYLAYGISYLGISFIGPSWFLFSFLYCGRRVARWAAALLFGLAALHYSLFLTNEYHHWFFLRFEVEEVLYGPVFQFHMGYTYACVLVGMVAVLREFQKKKVAALHLFMILLSAAIPLSFNVLYMSRLVDVAFDLTPPAFALSSLLMLLAVFRYDFLDVNALAFEQILASIGEGVAVYNKRGTMVYVNPAASRWMGIREGEDFQKLAQGLASLGMEVEKGREPAGGGQVVALEGGVKLRVKQYIRRTGKGELTAGTFLLTDVGEYYERIRQGRELAVSAQRLAIEQERNRIAQEVHDTTGHSLTMIQSLLRLARVEWEGAAPGKAPGENGAGGREACIRGYLEQAQELAAGGIRDLRCAINQMRQEMDYELVAQGVFQLAKSVKEIEVEVEVQGEDGPPYSHLSTVVYQCLREAVTNCLKYAQATHMDVIVKFAENDLNLYIFDNGQGCENLVEHNGIRGIRERVARAGGQVRFLSSKGGGFQIFIHLPVEVGEESTRPFSDTGF